MVLYNITTIIEESIQESWLRWMRSEFIPTTMETGLFVSNRTLKVLDSPNEGFTYCVQFVAESLENCALYQAQLFANLQLEQQQKFENKLVSFNTIMEYID